MQQPAAAGLLGVFCPGLVPSAGDQRAVPLQVGAPQDKLALLWSQLEVILYAQLTSSFNFPCALQVLSISLFCPRPLHCESSSIPPGYSQFTLFQLSFDLHGSCFKKGKLLQQSDAFQSFNKCCSWFCIFLACVLTLYSRAALIYSLLTYAPWGLILVLLRPGLHPGSSCPNGSNAAKKLWQGR